MDGGDLHEHIIERIALRGDTVAAMDEAEVRQVTWRMLQGLKYMHDVKKMMHRDIKPGNVLLAKRGVDGLGDPTTAKLSDFGTSRQMGDLSRANTLGLGTVAYTAPEISAAELSGTTAAQGGYTNACDVWSVGVSLYVMLVQVYPCGTANNAHEARGVRYAFGTLLSWGAGTSHQGRHLLSASPCRRVRAQGEGAAGASAGQRRIQAAARVGQPAGLPGAPVRRPQRGRARPAGRAHAGGPEGAPDRGGSAQAQVVQRHVKRVCFLRFVARL